MQRGDKTMNRPEQAQASPPDAQPKISVIVPTCDRPTDLAAALTSVFQQTVQHLEVIVVDNGTEPVRDHIREKFPGAKTFRIPPYAGASIARNWGAMQARGNYLAFLDDDDAWPNEYLHTMVENLERNNLGLVAAPNRDLKTGQIIAVPIPIPPDRPLKQWRALAYMGSNMLMLRHAFWSVGGFPPRLVTGEDRALVIRLHLAGVPIGRCTDTFVLRKMEPSDRLTNRSNLLLGKLAFLEEFRSDMPTRDRDEDQLSFLFYLSRSWRWPVWIVGSFCAPRALLRRIVKHLTKTAAP